MNPLFRHVAAHPVRLIVTAAVLMLISWTVASASVYLAFRNQSEANVNLCRSLNELRRQLFVAFTDLGETTIAYRFIPTESCERLP